ARPSPTPATRSMGRRKSACVRRAIIPPRRRTARKTASASPTADTRRAVSGLSPPRPESTPAMGSDQPTTSTPATTSPASPRASRRNPRQNPRSAKRMRSSRRTASRAVISGVRSCILRAVSAAGFRAGSCHRVARGASNGALARGHGLFLPSNAGLLVVLSLAEFREYTSFLALFLESADGAIDGLVLFDSNPCHVERSPPLGGKVLLFGEKSWAVKARAPKKKARARGISRVKFARTAPGGL